MTNNTENKKQEFVDKTDDINTENNKELDENLEQQNENDTYNKDKSNKDIKLHIAIATVSLSLIVAGTSLAFIKHNANNNIDDELPSFTMENGELVLGDITEDKNEDEDENIEYTFNNLPQDITDISKFSKKINTTYEDLKKYSNEERLNGMETENGEFIEVLCDKNSGNIRVLKYNEAYNLLKDITIDCKAEEDSMYDIIEIGDNLLLTKQYINPNNTEVTELLLFNSKGTLLNSMKLTPNLYIDNMYYSKETDRILITYSDLRGLNYMSQYDKNLNKINQFKMGKNMFNTSILPDKEYITIFSESTIYNEKQDEIIYTTNMSKYDYNGKQISHKEITDLRNFNFYDIRKSDDEGFILLLNEPYEEDEDTISFATFFVKVDKNGNIVWQLKNPERLNFMDVYELEDGLLVFNMSEFTSNEDKDVSTAIPTFIKYDYSGKEIWRKYSSYLSEDNDFKIPGYYLVLDGTVKNNEIEFNGQYIKNNEYFAPFKFKMNSNGEFIKY